MSISNKTFIAWSESRSGQPMIHVAGIVDAENESDSFVLEFEGSNKSRPPQLLAKLVPSTIIVDRTKGDTIVTVHLVQSDADQYGSVRIQLPDGEAFSIDPVSRSHAGASKTPSTPKQVIGTLVNDMMTTGGEGTGWAIRTDGGDVMVDVDAVRDDAERLKGTKVRGFGRNETRGVEMPYTVYVLHKLEAMK